tara:strand:+ start:3332 stop:4330 length:999 start_codon:yes stop_codon:yes gene_type:complete
MEDIYKDKTIKMHEVNGVKIAGIVNCIPSNSIDNLYFEKDFNANEIKQVCKATGVSQRFQVDESTRTADLCEKAANDLLENLKWERPSIDGLIFITQTPNQSLPPTACQLHKSLNLSSNSFAFDINLGCSAYPYGLWLAGSLIKTGSSRVLLLVGDTISKITNPSDRSTRLLFGDAGSATAIESGGEDSWKFLLGTDGSGADSLKADHDQYLTMDGSKVFEFTLSKIPDLVKSLEKLNGGAHEKYLFHQANLFMLKHLRRKCEINNDSFPINIQKYGNTSSASIPLLLSDNLKDFVQLKRSNIALVGFGVGFSWSAASMCIGPISIIKTISY